jgi:hypothetical protein
MPISLSKPGYDMALHERIGALVAGVGGPVKAAAIIGKSRGTIDDWRREGTRVPLTELLPLCVENGVSLDWVATGYQVRPDLAGIGGPELQLGEGGSHSVLGAGDTVRLMPLWGKRAANVERFEPSEIPFAVDWLQSEFGLSADDARYVHPQDDGMAPIIARGSLAIVDVRETASPRSGIYVLELGDEQVARRLNLKPDGSAELVADANPGWRYPLPEGTMLRRIVWAGQKL